MKKQEQTTQRDPWNELAQNADLTNVPLEQVLANLRVSQREATAVKKGLLDQVSQLCDDTPARKR
jgi:hypothetical protein